MNKHNRGVLTLPAKTVIQLVVALPFIEQARAMCFNPPAQQGLDTLIEALHEIRELWDTRP